MEDAAEAPHDSVLDEPPQQEDAMGSQVVDDSGSLTACCSCGARSSPYRRGNGCSFRAEKKIAGAFIYCKNARAQGRYKISVGAFLAPPTEPPAPAVQRWVGPESTLLFPCNARALKNAKAVYAMHS